MPKSLMLPVGVEDFREIRNGLYYYVDKTEFIEELFEQRGKVNLFTRPRRFGKTLNMSMLKHFFAVGTDKELFNGLYISRNKELCNKYMGQFPVISITLKGLEALTFNDALKRFALVLGREADRFDFLANSTRLTEKEKSRYKALSEEKNGLYKMDEITLISSLKTLSELLYKHYGQKVILLIDEYDVPLDKAFQNGYYREMVSLIKGIFGEALKTNEYLELAVLTGCLRVAKESIFTGLNNFNVFSIIDPRFDAEFGFTEAEVEALLKFYGLESHMTQLKEWYDGYRFGDEDIYCPWDVLNHTQRLLSDSKTKPQAYWINSSGNSLVKRFIDKADKTTRDEIEILLNGETIEKEMRLELTYDEIDNSIDNVWSVLFTTGYLTKVEELDNGIYKLRIPNEEIKEVYRTQIKDWFKEIIRNDKNSLNTLWTSFRDGNAEKVEKILTNILGKTISVFDPKGSEKEKEKYYHAFLSGILIGNGEWGVLSNRESGEGFPDIMVEMDDPNAGMVIELKSVDKITALEGACDKAMEQIRSLHYEEYLVSEGRNNIWGYAIAFYKKRCKVIAEKMKDLKTYI